MTACAKCGHDSAAIVGALWTFEIAREVHSLNARSINTRDWRGAVYKRNRDAWQWMFKIERINQRIPIATGRRRVTITRIYSDRQREFDRDNFHGGCKVVIDAMVREQLLVDDKHQWAEVLYEQVKDETSGLRVLLEDLA